MRVPGTSWPQRSTDVRSEPLGSVPAELRILRRDTRRKKTDEGGPEEPALFYAPLTTPTHQELTWITLPRERFMSQKRKDAGNAVYLIGFGLLLIFGAAIIPGYPGVWILGWIFLGGGVLLWKSL